VAYKVIRVKISAWNHRFKGEENDTSFHCDSYPELDDHLSVMEERGWTVISTCYSEYNTGGYLIITMHQQDS
jgi:hypothetical protein